MLVFTRAAVAAALALVSATPFDESLAVGDLWLSQATGCGVDSLKSWSCGVACSAVPLSAPLLAINNTKATLAIVGRRSEDPGKCVVVVRGSKNFRNWLQDADFPLVDLAGCDGCKVHGGFLADWRSLQEQVTAHLSALGCAATNGKTVELIGHSLGAGVVALAAYDLTAPTSPFDVQRTYTYGQPRVGNGAFATSFGARLASHGAAYYRVVDYKDAVPQLPWRNMLGENWTHTSPEIYYNRTQLGAWTECADPTDTRCSAQWNLAQTLTHTCDHCSYLGMNPCDCNSTTPECEDPKGERAYESAPGA